MYVFTEYKISRKYLIDILNENLKGDKFNRETLTKLHQDILALTHEYGISHFQAYIPTGGFYSLSPEFMGMGLYASGFIITFGTPPLNAPMWSLLEFNAKSNFVTNSSWRKLKNIYGETYYFDTGLIKSGVYSYMFIKGQTAIIIRPFPGGDLPLSNSVIRDTVPLSKVPF